MTQSYTVIFQHNLMFNKNNVKRILNEMVTTIIYINNNNKN